MLHVPFQFIPTDVIKNSKKRRERKISNDWPKSINIKNPEFLCQRINARVLNGFKADLALQPLLPLQ